VTTPRQSSKVEIDRPADERGVKRRDRSQGARPFRNTKSVDPGENRSARSEALRRAPPAHRASSFRCAVHQQ
jgi:hypothetical protein